MRIFLKFSRVKSTLSKKTNLVSFFLIVLILSSFASHTRAHPNQKHSQNQLDIQQGNAKTINSSSNIIKSFVPIAGPGVVSGVLATTPENNLELHIVGSELIVFVVRDKGEANSASNIKKRLTTVEAGNLIDKAVNKKYNESQR